ncbi:MAG: DUF2807 domain-containing protein [Muribaculaceae bacterium]|nr:DUF2807 domain-containing protein [Muribaculaceae bacterium]
MKRFFAILALILCILVPAQAHTETFRLKVGQFDKLAVYDNVHVVYHANPDSTGYVVYRADENLADIFLFSNVKGTLKIQLASENVSLPNLPELHVYSDYLTQVENSSDYSVKILSNSSVPRFTARMMGNGEILADNIKAGEVEANFVTGNGIIAISGNCEKAVYKMVGAGTIQADEMKAKNVNCKIMGAGSIGCWANDKLDVRGIGSTRIYYKGKPQVKKVGGGKLVPLTQEDEGESERDVAQHK